MGTLRGGSSGMGLRANWERRQQAAELAAAPVRLPALAASKPAFFTAQLQPVLDTLWHAGTSDRGSASSGSEEEENVVPLNAASRQQPVPLQWLAETVAHLHRLEGIDRHGGANTSLLLFLLLRMATSGGKGQAAEGAADLAALPLLQLCGTMGWQKLVLEALPLLLPHQQRQLERSLVAAAGNGASGAQQQADLQQLALRLALRAQQHLDAHLRSSSGGGGSRVAVQQGQLADVALLQQLLLVCPASAAAPAVTAALQQLQAAADSCMARVMHSMQQEPAVQRHQQHQPLFQQLCQLRARLMLTLAAASGGGTGGGSSTCRGRYLEEGASQAPTAHVWRQVLQMPPTVSAAVPAANRTSAAAARHPSRLQFLAACVASKCVLQMACVSGSDSCNASSSGSADSDCYGRHPVCAALPGVHFELPPLPARHPLYVPHASLDSGSGSNGATASSTTAMLAAAAGVAADELARDPGCLGPAQLVLATLQLAAEQCAADSTAQPEAGATEQFASEAACTWSVLLDLAACAAADVANRSQQCLLLLLLLHGQQSWHVQLRRMLAADPALQQRCRRELVAVANRLSADAGSGGEGAAVVHGEERRRRTAAAVLALLPHALLFPAAVLERLVREAVVQAGEQVDLLLDVLREMWPLAAYREQQQQQQQDGREQQPLLLLLLAQLLVPDSGQPQTAVLDTPGSQEAFLQLGGGLCGAAHAKTRAATAGSATAGAVSLAGGEEPLFRPAALLQHVVAPALQRVHQQGQQIGANVDLLLPLQLADVLLTTAGQNPWWQQQEQLCQLQPLLSGLLDMDTRRIDRSPAALQAAGADTLELAAGIVGRSGTAVRDGVAGRYLQQQLQPLLLARQQPEAAQKLQQLRQGMVQLLAALLPCCTAAEAQEVLQAALPATIQAAMIPGAAAATLAVQQQQQRRGSSAGAILPGAHAAAMEATCRAARALALRPDQAPIAGEQLPLAVDGTGAAAAAGGAGPPPSALRQVAVERMLQHLTQHSIRLASAGGAPPLPAGRAQQGGAAAGLRLTPADGQALGLRCFRELCQLAAAVQPAQYDCATLQTGLLQLVQQLLRVGGVAGAAAAAAGLQQQAPLSVAQVRQQLAVGVATLPAGRLRDIALVGIEQVVDAATAAP